jgi:MFS superfamily sulfate permease-like transporter
MFGDVTSRIGPIALITLGVAALILGGIWTGQGLNLIPGSFMTGNRMWFYFGLVLAITGVILIMLGLQRLGHGHTSR